MNSAVAAQTVISTSPAIQLRLIRDDQLSQRANADCDAPHRPGRGEVRNAAAPGPTPTGP